MGPDRLMYQIEKQTELIRLLFCLLINMDMVEKIIYEDHLLSITSMISPK